MKVRPFILTALLCASCIYPYDMEIPAQAWALTVDGDILIGEVSVFRLGRLSQLDGKGDDQTPIWALCWIEDDEGTVYRPLDFHRSDSAQIDLTLAPPDRAYRLRIAEDFTGFSYSTPWLTPLPAPVLDSISFARDPLREEVSVRVSLTGAGAESPYVQVDYVEQYQFHSLFVPKVRYVPNEGYYRFDSDYPYWCYREVPSREPQQIQLLGTGAGKAVNHSLLKRQVGSEPLQKQYAVDVTARSISRQAYAYRHGEATGSDFTGDLFTRRPAGSGEISNVSMIPGSWSSGMSMPSGPSVGAVCCWTVPAIRTFRPESRMNPSSPIRCASGGNGSCLTRSPTGTAGMGPIPSAAGISSISSWT